MRFIFILAIILFSANNYNLYSQEGIIYKNDKSKSIYLPLGKISFADSIVTFNIGKPLPYKKFRDSSQALHEPNYRSYNSPEYVSLGCKGSLTVAFTNNGFMNLSGNDLYIFEVGPSAEAAKIEISEDGINWIFAGDITGGKSSLELSDENIPIDKVYYFLRITDYKEVCKSKTAGADIDAIGAINCVIKLSINADLLFDFDDYKLIDSANEILNHITEEILKIEKATLLIEGHTDSNGNDNYNMELSKKRSVSVKEKLLLLLEEKGNYDFIIENYGESKPKVLNTSEFNMQLNRRVEITILPPSDYYKSLKDTKN